MLASFTMLLSWNYIINVKQELGIKFAAKIIISLIENVNDLYYDFDFGVFYLICKYIQYLLRNN